jgi:glucose/arabinose dehydrogenase
MVFGRSRAGISSRFAPVSAAVLAAAVTVSMLSTQVARARPGHRVRADRVAPISGNSPGTAGTVGTTIPMAPLTVRTTRIALASQPVGAFMRSDDDTIYVVEKLGKIRAWRNGTFVEPPVLDITSIVDSDNERGLLGLAFRPDRRDVLYVDYTDKRGNVRVSELPFDGNLADLTKERNLLELKKPFNEHNAGTLLFDASGNLYVAIGDGGGSNDRFNNGQRKDVLLGKVLRIDPTPNGKTPYGIPAGNPFTTGGPSRARPEILAYGLRNPWQISLDPDTGDLWIPDVGEHSREEINRMPQGTTGSNFGWKLREGLSSNGGARPVGAVDPIYDYPHNDGRCAVVGGVVYRGAKLRVLDGMYIFGDVCTGALSVLRPSGRRWEALSLGARIPYLTSVNRMNDAELVATSLEGGIFRIEG